MPIRAAIDVGSNSIKLLVIELDDEGGYSILHDDSRVTGLGQNVGADGRLTEEAMACSLELIREYQRIANDLGAVEVQAAGTAAMRNASNAAEFVDQVKSSTGINLRIISGEVEARLAREVALGELADPLADTLFFDVGGGSTELTHCIGGKVAASISLELGARRMTDAAQLIQPVSESAAARLNLLIADTLQQALLVPDSSGLILAGLGGTASNAVWLLRGQLGAPKGDPHQAVVGLKYLEMLIGLIAPLELEAVAALPNLDPKRAPVIYAGLAIIAALLRRYDVDEFTLIDRGLRFGLALAEPYWWQE